MRGIFVAGRDDDRREAKGAVFLWREETMTDDEAKCAVFWRIQLEKSFPPRRAGAFCVGTSTRRL